MDIALPSSTPQWSIIRDVRRQQLLFLAVLWIAGAIVATIFIMHETNEMFDNALRETAHVVAAHDGEAGAGVERIALAGDRRKYMTFQLRNEAGAVLARSSNAPAAPFAAPLTPGFIWIGTYRYFTERLPGGTLVQVAEFYDERRDAALGLLAGFTVPLLALLGLGGLLISRSLQKIAQPIAALNAELRARGGLNLEPIEDAGTPDELRPIVDEANMLLARVRQAFEAERAFSANCAHELRNPIASARAQIEVIAMSPEIPSNRARLQTISMSLMTIGQRIERLLQLSRADAGVATAGDPADLAAITKLLVDDYVASGKPIDLSSTATPGLRVAADSDALGILLQNLIDNALSYAAPETQVEVRIDDAGGLRVTNDCPVINPATLAKLTERFRRDRGAKIGGYGVGLSIVGELLRQTGGRIELRSPASGRSSGFEAIVTLPVVAAD